MNSILHWQEYVKRFCQVSDHNTSLHDSFPINRLCAESLRLTSTSFDLKLRKVQDQNVHACPPQFPMPVGTTSLVFSLSKSRRSF